MVKTSPQILHIGPLPPPLGGVGVMMQSLIQAPSLQTFNHTCFNTSWGTAWEFVGQKRLDTKRVVRRIKLAAQITKFVKQSRPDIVHFQCGSGGRWDFPGDMLMFWGAKASGAKMVFHWHRDPRTATFPGRSSLTRQLFKTTADKADATLVLSEIYRKALKNREFDCQIFVVPNTFDPALLSLPRPRSKRKNIQIIFLGRLTREKGVLDLLQVASMVMAKAPNVNFVLGGTPDPYEGGIARLKAEIAHLGLESKVTMVGAVTGEAKMDFFRQADLLLFPSHRESFGITALEGMAAGIPVLAYKIGILPELVAKPGAGFLVKQGDTQALTHHVLQLVENPALREEMGYAGRTEACQNYSVDAVANKVGRIYMTLLRA